MYYTLNKEKSFLNQRQLTATTNIDSINSEQQQYMVEEEAKQRDAMHVGVLYYMLNWYKYK